MTIDELPEFIKGRIQIAASGCWIWTGRTHRGYGYLHATPRFYVRAHRLVYGMANCIVPRELDHLCGNKACVNPAHLEGVTHRENVLRGASPSAVNSKKTHCIHGHLLSGHNIRRNGRPNVRVCRECYNQRRKASRARQKETAHVHPA